MFNFLYENLGTIIISAALLAAVAGITVNLARKKRKGKCGGCSCCK